VKQLGNCLPLILDAGDTGAVLASTIVRIDGNSWTLAREGALPEEEILKALKSGSPS
jgi:tRNA A37 threonylcarbamoyladenosine synthetase subunit TsaC/SUA5/YrdC